jgi:hypothetical protein
MGAATVAENSLKTTTNSIWNAFPRLPSLRFLDFDLNNYNKSFVNFAVIVGVAALAKSTISLAGNALKSKPKVPTKQQLLDKYGHMAWAMIADCRYNYFYVQFLAKNGFNLILMGEEDSIRQCRELAKQIDNTLLIEEIVVDWAK